MKNVTKISNVRVINLFQYATNRSSKKNRRVTLIGRKVPHKNSATNVPDQKWVFSLNGPTIIQCNNGGQKLRHYHETAETWVEKMLKVSRNFKTKKRGKSQKRPKIRNAWELSTMTTEARRQQNALKFWRKGSISHYTKSGRFLNTQYVKCIPYEHFLKKLL